MDELDGIQKSKTGLIVAVLVGGIAVLALGLYLAYQKKSGGDAGGGAAPDGGAEWCKTRQDWAREVRPLAGEIMVAGVKADNEAALSELVVKRNKLCNEKAKKLRDLLQANPKLWTLVQPVEELLIREGKTRSNVAVEIGNARSNMTAGSTEELTKHKDKFVASMKKRIEGTEATVSEELKAALAVIKTKGLPCSGIYRGPMTDAGTSGNAHTSWEELRVKRTLALKGFDQALEALQPMEDYSNRIRHDIMSRYKGTLKKCYTKVKKLNPEMSDKLGLRVRVSKKGKVATLAIEWMANREERILDCLLDNAGEWKLPVPDPEIEYGVISVDFTAL